jgi:predicted TIM-barrel fold metal-dependent hydrolase
VEFVAKMDACGITVTLIAALKMMSFGTKSMMVDFSVDDVWAHVSSHPERLKVIAGYNPFSIRASLDEISRAAREYDCRGVYFHPHGFGLAVNDARYFPLYALCDELEIPVAMQVGHSMELMPSAGARPVFLEDVALAFPSLIVVGAHTGWPWIEEMIAVAWKFENVYVGIDAHLPKYLDPSLVRFMKSRGADKVIFGTNGVDPAIIMEQWDALDVPDEPARKILWDNAARIYGLD